MSTAAGPQTGVIQLQDTFPNGKAVGVFSDAIKVLITANMSEDAGHWSNTEKIPEAIAQKCFNAALAMTKCIGLERWNEITQLWNIIASNKDFNVRLQPLAAPLLLFPWGEDLHIFGFVRARANVGPLFIRRQQSRGGSTAFAEYSVQKISTMSHARGRQSPPTISSSTA